MKQTIVFYIFQCLCSYKSVLSRYFSLQSVQNKYAFTQDSYFARLSIYSLVLDGGVIFTSSSTSIQLFLLPLLSPWVITSLLNYFTVRFKSFCFSSVLCNFSMVLASFLLLKTIIPTFQSKQLIHHKAEFYLYRLGNLILYMHVSRIWTLRITNIGVFFIAL